MAPTKATKKFGKNHLHDTIKRRKDFAKVKQRHQLNAKKKVRRAEENGRFGAQEEDDEKKAAPPTKKQKKQDIPDFEDMAVDDFFAGGFEVPEEEVKVKRKAEKSAERKRASDEMEEDGIDVSGEEDEEDVEDDEVETHKQDLKAVAEKDPEFYKFLQENDPELLDFAEKADLDEVDELSGSEAEVDGTKGGKKKRSKREEATPADNLTKAKVKNWTQAMVEKHSLRSMREIVLAFRAAAHLDDEEEAGKKYKYTINDADVYHDVLLSALQHVPEVLNHHLPVKELSNGRVRVSTDTKKFRTLTQLLKSHALSLHHLLDSLSDAATLKLTLSSLHTLLPHLLSFKKLLRDLLRSTTDIWATASHTEATRISAFLVLRRVTVISDPGIRETVLRTVYQGLLKGSRNTTQHTIAGINLMKNSAAELWGLTDPDVAYTSGFTLIRQLAIHLRGAIKDNSNDSFRQVYNWQYVHALDFWSRVLSTHCETLREATLGRESPLRPLIYPLVQVTLGAMRLLPTAAYFPLRFHLVRALIRLSHTTHTYIPLAAQLYEVLTSGEMRKRAKPSTLKPLDFETTIHAAKGYLRTKVYQDGVGEQTVELLGEFFNVWTKSIAFPELALPVLVMLKRWLKDVAPFNAAAAHGRNTKGKNGRSAPPNSREEIKGNRNSRLNSSVHLIIQKLEANSRWIEERRAKVDFAPNNRAGVEGFLKETEWTKTPLGAFVEGQRKGREERRRVLEEARKADQGKGRSEKGKGREEVDETGESAGSESEGEIEMEDEVEEELEEEVEEEEEEEDEIELE